MKKPAVFLDRDGTLIAENGYLCTAGELRLLPGAARGVRWLQEAGFRVILVTNQSAVARGLLTEKQLAEINKRLLELLKREGARLDAIYYCPHHPEGLGPYRQHCCCRKPEPGMLLQAAAGHGLNLGESYLVGDKLTDIIAGKRAGCRTILVKTGCGERELARAEKEGAIADFVVENVERAARLILAARTGKER